MSTRNDLLMFKAFRFFVAHGLLKTLRRSGFVLYRHTVIRFIEWRFDRRFGTSTRGNVHFAEDSGHPLHRFALPYEATAPNTFNRIMRSIGCMTAPFTFFDLGCGKGRVLIMAAQYGFKRIVGVEFDAGLARIAETNTAEFRARSNSTALIGVVHQDAAQFRFPDENAVIFLFNPFTREIMEQVLQNIRSTAHTAKYRYIIYHHAVIADLFSDPTAFSVVAREKEYVIYRMHL